MVRIMKPFQIAFFHLAIHMWSSSTFLLRFDSSLLFFCSLFLKFLNNIQLHGCIIFMYVYVCVCTQSCPTLCSTMDCSLSGSSIHGIFQVRIMEQVASSRESSKPRDWTQVSCISSPALQADSLPLTPPLLIHILLVGYLDWFQVLEIKNKASVNIHMWVYMWL